MDAAHGTRRQLGRLLIEKGVLSEAQLELALAEQQASGRPLGEVAVSLGFASGAVVGNALAEQHGGPLRTEYGFAAGPSRMNGRLPLKAGSASHKPGAGREHELRAALEDQAAVLASARAELAEAKVEAARAGRERDEVELALRAAEVELREARHQFSTRLTELDEQLRERTLERDQLLRSREATDAPKAMEDVAPDERHLLFVPGPGGYSMVEHGGPAPTAGGRVDIVDADGVATPFVVMKVGRSPLPRFGGRCAFLARA